MKGEARGMETKKMETEGTKAPSIVLSLSPHGPRCICVGDRGSFHLFYTFDAFPRKSLGGGAASHDRWG